MIVKIEANWKMNADVFQGQLGESRFIEVKIEGAQLFIKADNSQWHELGAVQAPVGFPVQTGGPSSPKIWDEGKGRVISPYEAGDGNFGAIVSAP